MYNKKRMRLIISSFSYLFFYKCPSINNSTKFSKNIFEIWDYNNTCGVTIFTNNTVRIDGEESLLKSNVLAIMQKKKFNVHDFDYFKEMNKENS